LAADDAQALETAFATRLSQFGEDDAVEHRASERQAAAEIEPDSLTVTTIAKPVRDRDRHHLRFVASQPCLVCGRTPSDAHHIKFAEQRAMGRKVSDRFTVPVCRLHHRELHRRGDERIWWTAQGVDPLPIAAALWGTTHALEPLDATVLGNFDSSEDPREIQINDSIEPVIRTQNRKTKRSFHREAE
jgi:hypothetical protein